MASRTILALAVMLLVWIGPSSAPVFAAPPVPDPRPAIEAKVAELVGFVAAGRMDAMLARIGPTPDPERASLEETREKLITLYGNSGKYAGFDMAGYKVLAPRFQVAYVMVYFEKRPVLFEIGFYNVDDAWRPQTFRVETSFQEILDTMPLQK